MKKVNKIISAFCVCVLLSSSVVYAIDDITSLTTTDETLETSTEETLETSTEEIVNPPDKEDNVNPEPSLIEGETKEIFENGFSNSYKVINGEWVLVGSVKLDQNNPPLNPSEGTIYQFETHYNNDYVVIKFTYTNGEWLLTGMFDKPIISVKKEIPNVHFKKKIINENGDLASQEDFKKLGLNMGDEYLFKIKMTNTENGNTYNIILENDEVKTFSNIPAGNYELEEIEDNYFDFVEFDSLEVIENKGKYYVNIYKTENFEEGITITVINKLEPSRAYEDKEHKTNLIKMLKNIF